MSHSSWGEGASLPPSGYFNLRNQGPDHKATLFQRLANQSQALKLTAILHPCPTLVFHPERHVLTTVSLCTTRPTTKKPQQRARGASSFRAEEPTPWEHHQCTGRLSKLFWASSYHSPWNVNLGVPGSHVQAGSYRRKRAQLAGSTAGSPPVTR